MQKIRMVRLPNGDKILKIRLFNLTESTNVTNVQKLRDGMGRTYAQHCAAKIKTIKFLLSQTWKRGYICGWNCTLFEDLQADGDAILKLSADADAVTDTVADLYAPRYPFLSASLYVSKRGAY